MTKQEQMKLRRLELENERLREVNDKHIDVYRDQAIELIELRATIELLKEVING